MPTLCRFEPLFNDPALHKTKFVMLHGGWPFSREAALLISKSNVYVDFSLIEFLTYSTEEARCIREYLEMSPEHVLYGSDASPVSQDVGWAETAGSARPKDVCLGIGPHGHGRRRRDHHRSR